jgi:hypothetical protein
MCYAMFITSGAVYRTIDTKLGRDVAIKVIPDRMARLQCEGCSDAITLECSRSFAPANSGLTPYNWSHLVAAEHGLHPGPSRKRHR